MKEIGAVTLLPVPGLEPDIDDTLDQLEDKFVPIEEDALPQGVLDLIAVLTVRHRPLSLSAIGQKEIFAPARTMQTMQTVQTKNRIDHKGIEHPPSPLRTQLSAPLQQLINVRMPFVAPVMDKLTIAVPRAEVSESRIERAVQRIEPSLLDLPSSPSEQAITTEDVHAPIALPIGSANRPLQAAAPVVIHRPDTMPPAVPLTMSVEELETPGRDFLQVPFNKGAANGQVTITRRPGESVPNLILSPSNLQVLEHLREPFEQSRDNHWRLTDTADEQPHHGSHQAPDDEPEEPEETPV